MTDSISLLPNHIKTGESMINLSLTIPQIFWVWENCILRCVGCGHMIKAACGHTGLVICKHVGDGTRSDAKLNAHEPYPYAVLKKGEMCLHPQYIQDPRIEVYDLSGGRLNIIPTTDDIIKTRPAYKP